MQPAVLLIFNIFWKYLGANIWKNQLAEISDFVSGEHQAGGGGTPRPCSQLCSCYFTFSRNIEARISEKPAGWNFWICIRRTSGPRRWHVWTMKPAVLLIFNIFWKYLGANISRKESAEISDFVSGEHQARIGGTPRPWIQLYIQYRNFCL